MDSCCASINEPDEKGYNPKFYSKGNIKEEGAMTRYEGGRFKEAITMADGKMKSSFTVHIDKEGKNIGGQSYDSTGKMDTYFTDLKENEYDAVTAGKAYKADSTLKYTFTNDYDKASSRSGQTGSAGKMIYENKMKVNAKGDLVEMNSSSVSKDSTIQRKETYSSESYDDQGNWTQSTTNDDKGKATKIVKRVISYYKKD